MPVNITQGNTARFVVEFLDANDDLVVPSSGTLVINYINVSTLVSTSATIGLTQTGSFFTGDWASGASTLGIVSWTVSAPDVASTDGTLRIIDP